MQRLAGQRLAGQRLAGKRALVTGGARGIGLAMARAFRAEGARVVVADRSVAGFAEAGVAAVAMDVSHQDGIDAGVAAALGILNGIDVLVNNAGVYDLAPIVDVTRESYDRLFAVNVAGTLFTMQAVARVMIAQGSGGRIINLASQAGRRGEPLGSVYCATKAAVISLTQSAGLNLIGHGITVNAIAPGVIESDMWDHVDALFAKAEGLEIGEKKRQVAAGVPFGRFGTGDEVAAMAVFLASDAAAYVVGQTYGVDGGNWMA
ncbi:L-iditol 2-dehydrogenase [Gemmobacter aquarius]|uniref:L-iditol 2-dehydrogenase n=1 Tax=Paragemmobacter aquarius TaxID=2169400 RepID=A0A2S0UJB9_9RHOB|nr:L-iditol 2-dehydrogenase [Gemmobacter aquarius]AWB47927.1 L-iditol 2-dehydrogenase [Gemmobacter aquarius]